MIFDELRVSGMICTIPTERKSPDGRDTEFIHCQVVIENIIREMYEKEKKE